MQFFHALAGTLLIAIGLFFPRLVNHPKTGAWLAKHFLKADLLLYSPYLIATGGLLLVRVLYGNYVGMLATTVKWGSFVPGVLLGSLSGITLGFRLQALCQALPNPPLGHTARSLIENEVFAITLLLLFFFLLPALILLG